MTTQYCPAHTRIVANQFILGVQLQCCRGAKKYLHSPLTAVSISAIFSIDFSNLKQLLVFNVAWWTKNREEVGNKSLGVTSLSIIGLVLSVDTSPTL